MGYGLFVKSVSAYLTASIIDAVLTAIFLYLIALRVQQSSNSSSSVNVNEEVSHALMNF